MLLRLLTFARAPVERAAAEVAVGDEGAHAGWLGERQCLAVVGLAALGVEPVGMGRDVAEQVQRMGRVPGMARREFDRAISQAPRLVEPAEHQRGATQRVVGPTEMADDPLRRVTLEKLLALRSAKRTVTGLRSPSSAVLEVRIFSARCFGVYVPGEA